MTTYKLALDFAHVNIFLRSIYRFADRAPDIAQQIKSIQSAYGLKLVG